ncbi:MAG: 50S ribosome-binding GTPase [Eubacteriales bacterium]|nr:50S ribosome-binding GTPase [Eubacteriales bacterium]
MNKGTVLLIGNSGVGKSTLINAIFGTEIAEVGRGIEGTTKEAVAYSNEEAPFDLVDTAGFEPSKILGLRPKAIADVKKLSRDIASGKEEKNPIDVIWFCVDGTSSKLFPSTINDMLDAVKIWKNAPIIVVITKSYSTYEQEENVKMVSDAFADRKKRHRYAGNLKGIIPVVAETYKINENEESWVLPKGLNELVDLTFEVLPEGQKAGVEAIKNFKLKMKRQQAYTLTALFTAAGVADAVLSLPITDTAVLSAMEIAEIKAIASVYEIKDDDKAKDFLNKIIECGTVSLTAKTALSTLKAIPGINIAASALNGVVAGTFVAAIGAASAKAFEDVYLGKRSLADTDWVGKFIESELGRTLVANSTDILEKLPKDASAAEIAKRIAALIKK